jgi:membrane-associated phospholipid phosphatase
MREATLPPVGLRDRITAAAPPPHRFALLGGLAAALAVLAALVQAGVLSTIDQFSADHLMPWLKPYNSSNDNNPHGFYRPFPLHSPNAIKILDLWSYPCSVAASALIVIGTGAILWRRHGIAAGLAPATAWVLANTIEVAGKGTLTKPTIWGTSYGERVHLAPFADSFPSGHMTRGVVVAWALALVWRRATPWLVLWAVLVGPSLVFSSAHTLTDVVGGALVGLLAVVAVHPLAVARMELAPR